MKTRHKLLERQIRRYLKSSPVGAGAELTQELENLFDAVSQAYHDFDADRALIERSQDLSSKELLEEKVKVESAAKALVDAQAKLLSSAKMSALGEMAGGMAHEINSPLSAIQMRADQMLNLLQKDGLKSIEPFIVCIEAIVKTVDRISHIIKGLRSFARDHENDPQEVVAVSEIIDGTLDFCRERIREQRINLSVEATVAVEISCRRGDISQVLLNLLNNSYDAVKDLSEKWIRIETLDCGTEVEIHITDSGSGIPQATLDRLMQPFFTTKAIGKGTGLGLSFSKGIAESHGGRLFVKVDCPNTKFVLRLPKISLTSF
jgi:C4-dicarboxylate-specific signal transduction histidine kinase